MMRCQIYLILCRMLIFAESQPVPPTVYAPISDGVPVSGYVAYGKELFYQMTVQLPLPRLLVSAVATGDVDLFATMGPFWDPVPGNFEWKSLGQYGPDVIFIPAGYPFTAMGGYCQVAKGATNCTLNVGVYGTRGSNFTLMVTLGQDVQQLVPATPTPAMVAGSAPAYFNFSASPGSLSSGLTFTATPADTQYTLAIYASLSTTGYPQPAVPASYCAYASEQTVGSLSGGVTLTIAPTSPCACPQGGAPAPCAYHLTVINTQGSDTNAFFVMTGAPVGAHTPLIDGLPASGSGSASASPALFTYSASLSTGAGPQSTVLSLTPLLGKVRMAVAVGSNAAVVPTLSAADYVSSGGPGAQSVIISASDASFVSLCPAAPSPCPMLIAVWTTSTTSSWVLASSTAQYTPASDGAPQQSFAPAGGVSYFRWTLQASQLMRRVSITVAALAGDPQLYIGADSNNATTQPSPVNPSTYVWSSVGAAGEEGVIIDPTSDPLACGGRGGQAGVGQDGTCSYYIAVSNGDAASGTEFVLLARTNSSAVPTVLVAGEVVMDTVPMGSAGNYYITQLDPTAATLTLALMPVQGSVSLYAGVVNGSSGQYAPVSSSTAPYALIASEVTQWQQVIVSVTDMAVQTLCSAAVVQSGSCYIGVTVLGNSSAATGAAAFSRYMLTASAGVRQLSDGTAVQATVQQIPDIVYFRYTVPARIPFTVTVTPISGDPDLFVSALLLPNSTWSQWSSHQPAIDSVVVQWSEPWINPDMNPRLTFPVDFYIGISGFDGPADFTVVATSNPYVQLSSGQPEAMQAEGGILKYFLLQLPPTAADGTNVGFSVSVTPISGDSSPNLYVNTVNHTAWACAHCGWPYCQTNPCDPEKIGNINRYWSSQTAMDPLFIEVDVMDYNYEPGEQYVIAVLCVDDCQYSITATFSTGVITISNQVPVTGRVAADGYTWYNLVIVNPDVVLTIVGTPLDGAPELYVSVNSSNRRPTSVAYDKAAIPGQGAAGMLAVVFDWSELPECPDSATAHTIYCHAYIGVRGGGGRNTTYTLVADAVKNFTELLLVDGQPQNNVVVQADYVYYYALVYIPAGTEYSVTLNPYATAKLDLYATTDGSRPSESNYQWSSIGENGPEQINILPSDPHYCNNCTLRVAVHHPFIDVVGFDITYSATATSNLLPGQPVEGNTQVRQVRYYSMPVYTPGDLIDVSLNGVSGSPQLFIAVLPPGVSTSQYRPTPAQACSAWANGGLQQTITIRRGDTCYCPNGSPCTYVVGVSCQGIPYHDPTCRYMLFGSPSTGIRIQLTDGVPLADSVGSQSPVQGNWDYRFFSFDMSIMLLAQTNLTVSASSSMGYPIQLLATTGLQCWPTLTPVLGDTCITWNSNSTGPPSDSAYLYINYNDAAVAACPTCTLVTVAVLSPYSGASTAVPFTIQASTTYGSPTWLEIGQPSTPVTAGYKTSRRFLLYLPDTASASDLVLTPTVLSGSLSFSIDPVNPRVSCFIGPPPNRTVRCEGLWASFDGSPLRISAANPCANAQPGRACDPSMFRAGPFYVVVFLRWSPTTYTLTASQPGAVVTLTDSLPQFASFTQTYPVQMQYLLDYSAQPVTVQFSLTTGSVGLQYWIVACLSNSPACITPGPSASGQQLSGIVAAQTTVSISLNPGDPVSCVSPQGTPCVFKLGLWPIAACQPPTCGASATVTASNGGSSSPVVVPWTSVYNSVFSVTSPTPSTTSGMRGAQDVTRPGSSLEVLLSPIDTGTTSVRFGLDYCGGLTATSQWPSLYLCDPSISPPLGCSNPFAPSSATGSFTAAVITTQGQDSSAAIVAQTAASVVYAALDAAVSSSWSVSVSAGNQALWLISSPQWQAGLQRNTRLPFSNASTSGTGDGQSLQWYLGALVSADLSSSAPLAGNVAVRYDVYIAPVGFQASVDATQTIVSDTVCGLQYWSTLVAAGKVSGAMVTSVIGDHGSSGGSVALPLSGLPLVPGRQYEAAVVVTCNLECAQLAFQGLPAAPAGVATYATQQAVYGSVRFTAFTGSGSGPYAPLSPGAIAGIIVGGGLGLALLLAALFAIRGCGKAADYQRVSGGAGLVAVSPSWKPAAGDSVSLGKAGKAFISSVAGSPLYVPLTSDTDGDATGSRLAQLQAQDWRLE